ncbi:hypothetical protein IE81DRAFT_331933 [Ceraceosorus guamensis]|uniref:Secreted protein n=1 Tax=Ceraceosorus guamensis TaxID=1522189 RepID=A0A316VR60_9BASI|nr:hypothetical protein IE81DRAFT_331933 [Ceraceosorus guamensis]PWN40002.1 hypothetical protein IE81DRAFT_331933 [Ceraceosorus guamensis]
MAFLLMMMFWAILYMLAFAHQKITALAFEIVRLRDQAQEIANKYQRLGEAGQQAALERFWTRLKNIAGKMHGAPEELLSNLRNNPLNTTATVSLFCKVELCCVREYLENLEQTHHSAFKITRMLNHATEVETLLDKNDQACERPIEYQQCVANVLELVDNVALQFEHIWNEWLEDATDREDSHDHAGPELFRPGFNNQEFRTAMAGIVAGLCPTLFQKSRS